MLNKNKSKTNTSSELHFVSSLQLEQSVILLGHIADDKHQVTLTEVTPDEFHFHIDYLPNRSKQAEISGNLKRWNGTETKVDADGAVLRLDTKEEDRSGEGELLGAILWGFLGSSFAIVMGQGWVVFPLVIGITGIAYYDLNSKNENKTSTVFFRHRDYLLQKLIDVFKSAGDVEAL